jgi:hypothetical protein
MEESSEALPEERKGRLACCPLTLPAGVICLVICLQVGSVMAPADECALSDCFAGVS